MEILWRIFEIWSSQPVIYDPMNTTGPHGLNIMKNRDGVPVMPQTVEDGLIGSEWGEAIFSGKHSIKIIRQGEGVGWFGRVVICFKIQLKRKKYNVGTLDRYNEPAHSPPPLQTEIYVSLEAS